MRLDLRGSRQQRAEKLLSAGCAVVFADASELSATYSLDDAVLDEIRPIARDAAWGLGLPGQRDTYWHPDVSGELRSFSGEQLQALYKALRDYRTAVRDFGLGRTPSLPELPVIIPRGTA